jgi:hypothetical protein
VDVQPPGGQSSGEPAQQAPERLPTNRLGGGLDPPASTAESASLSGERRFAGLSARIGTLVRAIQDNDEARIEEAILHLSKSRRVFAPLAFAVGAFVMLFDGLRLLVTNWRLTLVQILPAMWIWVAMLDLKAHVLHGDSFNVLRGPLLIPIALLIIAITVASFFLNAVFAFAVSQPGRPEVRPAVAQARRHLRPIMASGAVIGALLAFSTIVVTRWGRPWFAISLGIVVGMMMVSYVAVPSRLIGAKPPHQSRRDKLAGAAVGGALSATVCTPALHARTARHPGARIERPDRFHPRDRRAGTRSHPASRRHRRRQGDQDERNPHHSATSPPRASGRAGGVRPSSARFRRR